VRQGKVYAQSITTIGGTEWSGLSQEAVQEIPAESIPCVQSFTEWLYTSYKLDGNRDTHPNRQEMQQQTQHTIRGKRITGNSVKFMRHEIQAETMEKYYMRKLGPRYEQIEWSILKKTLIKKRAKGAFLKMLHGVSPTQKHMAKIILISHPECPCCSKAEEDIFHILNCRERSHKVVATFTEAIKRNGKISKIKTTFLNKL
jgi:hypothetical protein